MRLVHAMVMWIYQSLHKDWDDKLNWPYFQIKLNSSEIVLINHCFHFYRNLHSYAPSPKIIELWFSDDYGVKHFKLKQNSNVFVSVKYSKHVHQCAHLVESMLLLTCCMETLTWPPSCQWWKLLNKKEDTIVTACLLSWLPLSEP